MRQSLLVILFLNIFNGFSQNYNNPLQIPPVLSGTQFNLTLTPSSMQFYPGVNTSTYGVNGDYLGPVLYVQQGDSLNINVTNNLPEMTTIHWHGLHIPAEMDGGPHSQIMPNDTWNVNFKMLNKASLNWFHPHPHEETGAHVTMGLAGLIIVADTQEAAINLPRTYGTDDFPLILQDRSYDSQGQFVVTALGDSMLVNGTPNPYLDAPAQMLRLRILNAANARVFNIGFSDNRNFYVIGSDGGLLPAPHSTNRLLISNGERMEILVDLSNDLGGSLQMMSYGSELSSNIPGGASGMMNGNSPLNAADFGILQINVSTPTSSPVTSVPSSLIPISPWNEADVDVTRIKDLTGTGSVGMSSFSINNQVFDMNVVNDTIFLNDIELWEVVNTTNIAHPFHLHDVQFYITSRNGNPPPAYERGLKDVFLIEPWESVKFITKFENFVSETVPYMYHCHNLLHEDNGMMGQFIVVDPSTNIKEKKSVNFTLNTWPNPAKDQWKLEFDSDYSNEIKLEVFDMTGKNLLSETLTMNSGKNIFNVNITSFSKGIYLIKVTGKEEFAVVKMIKE
ncbi:MAG: multicopper oxidase domain-containing protein [Bacteroidota bacterium]|nr:multicopper oxidase domain-containing protein [Bacteroidota bacterium]